MLAEASSALPAVQPPSPLLSLELGEGHSLAVISGEPIPFESLPPLLRTLPLGPKGLNRDLRWAIQPIHVVHRDADGDRILWTIDSWNYSSDTSGAFRAPTYEAGSIALSNGRLALLLGNSHVIRIFSLAFDFPNFGLNRGVEVAADLPLAGWSSDLRPLPTTPVQVRATPPVQARLAMRGDGLWQATITSGGRTTVWAESPDEWHFECVAERWMSDYRHLP